jgi:hypothetical protein
MSFGYKIFRSNPFYDGPSLAAMCTSSCTTSLSTYRANVVSACGTYQIPGPNDVAYARQFSDPKLQMQLLNFTYSDIGRRLNFRPICGAVPDGSVRLSSVLGARPLILRSTTNEFCNEVLSTFGPTPAQGLLGYPTNELCTPCMLGTMNATLSNPLTFYPDFYAVLQSALKICGS